MNYTCIGVLICVNGLLRQRNWYDSSKLLDEQQIKETGGRWQRLLPLPMFSAEENEDGSASRVISFWMALRKVEPTYYYWSVHDINHMYALRIENRSESDPLSCVKQLSSCKESQEKIWKLQWDLYPWLCNTSVMLYQLSYEALWAGSIYVHYKKTVGCVYKQVTTVAKFLILYYYTNPFKPEPAGQKVVNFPELAATDRSDWHFILSRPHKGKMFLSFVLMWYQSMLISPTELSLDQHMYFLTVVGR